MPFVAVIGLGFLALICFAIGSGTNGAAAVATAIFIPTVIVLYFAPAINASRSGHPQKMAITVLNVLLGWTVLGWIGALVWSYGAPSKVEVVPAVPPSTMSPVGQRHTFDVPRSAPPLDGAHASEVQRAAPPLDHRHAFDRPTAAPVAAASPSDEFKDCPFCAEPIKRAAIKCKHCGSMLESA